MSYFSNCYNSLRYPVASEDRFGLRRAQLGAIHAIASHFTLRNEPAIVVMPTGAGKTAVLMMTAFVQRATRVLVITPSRLVRNQIAEDFSNLDVLKKIGVLDQEVHKPKVSEVVNIISDSSGWDAIREYDVIVSTPKSISPAFENIAKPPEGFFDLILVDEAHHSPAVTWEEILKCFPDAQKVLFTATPFRQDRKEIKGRIVYNYSLSEAYKDKVYGNIEFMPVKAEGYDSNDIAIAVETEKVFLDDKEAGLEHYVMVRTESKKRAKELQEIYEKNTKLNLQMLNSDCSYKHIKKTIEKLKNKEIDGIICVDMLGEGFDFPNLKIAAIHTPHRSLAITLQFIGRFARTNASNIGVAKFLAVPSEIRIETAKLFQEGAVWQKMVTNLSESKMEAEIEVREQIEKFEVPAIYEEEADDLSLYSLNPYNHVKIYRVSDFDIDGDIILPTTMTLTFKQKSKQLNSVVFITKETQKPLWSNVKKFEKVVYDLFVIYFDMKTQLLFICASRKTDALYEQIAKCFTSSNPKPLPLSLLNKVLIDLKNPEFFNVGMRNRVLSSNTESYRIIAGSNAHKAIRETDGRLYHRGHLFGRGLDKNGQLNTIGFSSSSKVWSNTSSQIPHLIKWCHEIAVKTSSNKEVTTNSALDLLTTGEIATKIPEGIIAANWEKEVFLNPMEITYVGNDGLSRRVPLLDVDIEIDRANSSENKISVSFISDGLDYTLDFKLNEETFFQAIDDEKQVQVIRKNYFTEYRLPLLDYLNSRPLNFYFADGSMLDGVNLFKNSLNPLALFNPEQIEVINWDEQNVDIQTEFGDLESGKISIHDFLMEYLKSKNYDAVFYDHGSGETADFIAIKDNQYRLSFEFYHCKGSGDLTPGNRVGDVYEVCGQAVKSVQWTQRNNILQNKLKRRKDNKLKHRTLQNRFIVGNEEILDKLFEQANLKHNSYEIIIVQPGITKGKLDNKIAEILAAANDYLIGSGCQKLRVMSSS
ncbi:DEAD/DEAH box helicase [Brevibacillus sp. GCM10020057]|uniref:DEAD/DEAH box helicase n=1 Tax=Brevibacillus sp. GCM10020057 TaxID=3317327 RepID=UPI00362E7726